jgi:hypothetical protein
VSSRRESSHECRCGPTTESPANPRRARATGCALSGALCAREGNGTGHTQHTARGPLTIGTTVHSAASPADRRTAVWCVYTCNRSLPQPVHLAGTYAHTKRHNSHVHHRDPYVRTIRDPHDIARRTHREWPWGACAHTCSRAHTCVHALGRPPRPTQPRTECSSSLAQRGKERGALQRDAETSLGKQADIGGRGRASSVGIRCVRQALHAGIPPAAAFEQMNSSYSRSARGPHNLLESMKVPQL